MSAPGRLPVDDDLFRPTIVNEPRPVRAPYRVMSLYIVGVLAGPYACTALALLNGRRLRVSGRVQAQVLGFGAIGVVLLLLVARLSADSAENYAISVPGLVVSFAQTRRLRPRERYWLNRGVAPASQLAVGLVVGLIGWVLAVFTVRLVAPYALVSP